MCGTYSRAVSQKCCSSIELQYSAVQQFTSPLCGLTVAREHLDQQGHTANDLALAAIERRLQTGNTKDAAVPTLVLPCCNNIADSPNLPCACTSICGWHHHSSTVHSSSHQAMQGIHACPVIHHLKLPRSHHLKLPRSHHLKRPRKVSENTCCCRANSGSIAWTTSSKHEHHATYCTQTS